MGVYIRTERGKERIMELVLYYGAEDPEMKKNVRMMKSVLVRMGVRIRNVRPDQVMETVGYLAGMPGFEEQEERQEPFPVIPEQMLVMKGFSGSRIDTLLYQLRRAGVPKIALKAIVTEHNCGWSFYKLYEELCQEHRMMTGQETDPSRQQTKGDARDGGL